MTNTNTTTTAAVSAESTVAPVAFTREQIVAARRAYQAQREALEAAALAAATALHGLPLADAVAARLVRATEDIDTALAWTVLAATAIALDEPPPEAPVFVRPGRKPGQKGAAKGEASEAPQAEGTSEAPSVAQEPETSGEQPVPEATSGSKRKGRKVA